MKTKKILTLVLAAALAVTSLFSLASCGGAEPFLRCVR